MMMDDACGEWAPPSPIFCGVSVTKHDVHSLSLQWMAFCQQMSMSWIHWTSEDVQCNMLCPDYDLSVRNINGHKNTLLYHQICMQA